MLRRTLENACQTAGATKTELKEMIDELAGKNQIHPINVQSAHKARLIGNFTAHVLRDVSSDEVAKVMKLVEKILEDLFVTPAIQKEIDTTKPAKKGS